MKIREAKTVEYRSNPVVRLKCDLCGVESSGPDWEHSDAEGKFDEVEIAVAAKFTHRWDHGVYGMEYEVDLCPACFVDRLVPWLRSQGGNVKAEEFDR